MNEEVEESGRVVCDGWTLVLDYSFTEDVTVARKNFMQFLQWPLFKNFNDGNEDYFS